jgi:putative flippase GtrA
MNNKPGPGKLKLLLLYTAFGVVVTFAVTILSFWIFQEIAQPIPMSLLIGALVGAAFMVFSNRVAAEQRRTKPPPRRSDPVEIEETDRDELASTDQK